MFFAARTKAAPCGSAALGNPRSIAGMRAAYAIDFNDADPLAALEVGERPEPEPLEQGAEVKGKK